MQLTIEHKPPIRVGKILSQAWRNQPGLTLLTGVSVVLLVLSGLGLLTDPRLIEGEPAWLKPGKFALSIALYAGTLVWMLGLVKNQPRLTGFIGNAAAGLLLYEAIAISFQAARGVRSHFNIGTPFDAVIFSTMGVAIGIVSFLTLVLAVVTLRQQVADGAMLWSIRFGLLITVIGMTVTGSLMSRPTASQMDGFRAGVVKYSGAHTVGADDGQPGLPGVGWSTSAGDLRVAHFVSLHALQLLPLLALLVRRRTSAGRSVMALWMGAAGYAGAVVALIVGALLGWPAFAVNPASLAAAACVIASAVGIALVAQPDRGVRAR